MAVALVPYTLDAYGLPRNPSGRTGRAGRNLGRWAENAACDAAVVTGRGGTRRILMGKRADRKQWAVPGGMLEPGESLLEAMKRELLEETSVDLGDAQPADVRILYVPDWRNADLAWVCSARGIFCVSDALPAVAGDDLLEVGWWPAPDLETLAAALDPVGGLYEPHWVLLAGVLKFCEATEHGAGG